MAGATSLVERLTLCLLVLKAMTVANIRDVQLRTHTHNVVQAITPPTQCKTNSLTLMIIKTYVLRHVKLIK
jgi:hypothetical protein